MEQISSKIKDLEDRISQLEDTKILKQANEKPKHPTVNTQEKVVKDNGKPDQQDEDVTFSNHAQKISECDYLILSDSILRRIIPKNSHRMEKPSNGSSVVEPTLVQTSF